MTDTEKQIKITVRHKGETREWDEHYSEAVDDPEKWARDLIAWFNRTRRDPTQKERELVKVVVEGEVAPTKHAWRKTNLVTIDDPRRGPHDKMRCDVCGVTGRRFGLNRNVVRDREFRSKVYARCDTAKAHIDSKRIVDPIGDQPGFD